MLDQIHRMLAYDTWANQRMLGSVRSVPQPSPRLLGLVAHVFSSKRMWLGRIRAGEDAQINTWPELSYEDSDALEAAMRADWEGYLARLNEENLQSTVHYTIKDVGPGQQSVGDIIMHKFLHAAYHRGQIATLVREEGGTPASTDFVVWAKTMRETGTT